MNNLRCRWNWRKFLLLFAVAVMAFGVPALVSTPAQVQAATTKSGLVTEDGHTYYYQDGKKVTNKWIYAQGGWRYFAANTGIMAQSEFVTTDKGNKYYQDKDGKRVFGWYDIGSYRYYFDAKSGAMKTGFITLSGKRYYLNRVTGKLYRSKIFRLADNTTYWSDTDGSLKTGWKVSGGYKYYFTTKGAYKNGWYNIGTYRYRMNEYGQVYTGWHTINGNKYYFIASGVRMGVMLRSGNRTVGTKVYKFSSSGVMLYEVSDSTESTTDTDSSTSSNSASLTTPSSERTIKNFLLGSLQPVGSTLYIWGGGHDDADATRKGVNSNWKTFYNSQSGSYNYQNHRFEYGKGLDCSGFVGWSIYQVLQTKSGGTNYTTLAESVASSNASRGFGTLYTQSTLSSSGYKFVAGDLACTSGHTWIVLGQCSDKSVVLVHSTPPCIQISGTPTPDGSYSSKAITLAQQYMKKYYGGTVSKFGLNSSSSLSYVKACNIMRWNTTTLSDPDGYRTKTANAILADLFS